MSSYKENISLRCIEPGRWTVAVMLYAAHDDLAKPIQVRVEIVGLNPQVATLFAKDVSLDRVGEGLNVISFDLDRQGNLTLAEPPLEDVTAHWLHRGGGYPGGNP